MSEHVLIDGNNLLHAMYAFAPIRPIGRETLVRIVERWARRGDDEVSLIFDGPVPRGGLAKQMSSARLNVRFSAPVTADDVIVAMIHSVPRPDAVRVVTGDKAIRHEARMRRCRHTEAVAFVRELYPAPEATATDGSTEEGDKPASVSPADAQAWVDTFDVDGLESPDDVEAMGG